MILTFGSNGQLGRELTRLSAERSVAMTALDSRQADIADREAVSGAMAQHTPAIVINAATYTNVDLAETERDKARRGNETGPAVLSEACARVGIPLVHVSTDYVFDGNKQGAYVESDPVCLINYYGASKAAGEAAIRTTLARHIILRTSWLYSEFGRNFLKTMVHLAATTPELRVVDDQYGCPTSARSLAEAILHIAPSLVARDENWGTFHFAGDGVTTWYGLASHIVAEQAPLTGHTPRMTPIGTAEYRTPATRPARSVLDCHRFTAVFG